MNQPGPSLPCRLAGLLCRAQALLDRTRAADFLAPLLLRAYLVPIFWMSGTAKIDLSTLMPKPEVIEWFGNSDWGLGLPVPTLMAFLAGWSELGGSILLALGLAVRWIALPLMVTMAVAAVTVHWENGWLAIAEGADSLFATERTIGAMERLEKAREILQQHGNYDWLTENGDFVILNNGIEFAATYFIMLLTLFFIGGGRYLSLDWWLSRCCGRCPATRD